jgi:hypothetical protein
MSEWHLPTINKICDKVNIPRNVPFVSLSEDYGGDRFQYFPMSTNAHKVNWGPFLFWVKPKQVNKCYL